MSVSPGQDSFSGWLRKKPTWGYIYVNGIVWLMNEGCRGSKLVYKG